MTLISEAVWPLVVTAIGFEGHESLLAMHFAEVEEEAENVLQLLAVLRRDARYGGQSEAQETAAELTIALEHLLHHATALLPRLQEQLELEP